MTNPPLTPEQRRAIDNMPYAAMRRRWETAPTGAFVTGEPWTEYFIAVMSDKHDLDPSSWD